MVTYSYIIHKTYYYNLNLEVRIKGVDFVTEISHNRYNRPNVLVELFILWICYINFNIGSDGLDSFISMSVSL